MSEKDSLHIHEHDVLLCNAGSATLKLLPLRVDAAEACYSNTVQFSGDAETLRRTLRQALAQQATPRAVLHRIVHAGAVTEHAQLIDQAVRERIMHWSVLAPLHNPLALDLVASIQQRWPNVPQYAVYDSGLYATMPKLAARYALPDALSPRWPLRRYGFHGLAHRSQWRSALLAAQQTDAQAPRRLISIHLGGGCSMTAWHNDRAIDTSMGFTPLEGLVMATRSGSIDPGLLLHLQQQEGMSAQDVNELITQHGGLAALATGQGDMRLIIADESPQAEQAVELYCYQIRKQIGAFIAALGGVDAITIGGGVGENQALVRERIFAPLQGLGIELDQQGNLLARGISPLHSVASKATIWLTPVNEMEEMFRQYKALSSHTPGDENE